VRHTLPWVCPECFDTICAPDVPRSIARAMWRIHARTSHVTVGANMRHSGPIRKGTWPPPPESPGGWPATPTGGANAQRSVPIREARAPGSFFECAECGEQVKQDCRGLHSLNCHPSNKQPQSLHVPVHRLSFTLLPPGEWDIRQVIEHYCKESHSFPSGLLGRKIDNSRLVKIASLGPLRCYIGKESWSGDVVFEFSASNCVVLECPFEGNATYVLSAPGKPWSGIAKSKCVGDSLTPGKGSCTKATGCPEFDPRFAVIGAYAGNHWEGPRPDGSAGVQGFGPVQQPN
jgi:hypothetical protein